MFSSVIKNYYCNLILSQILLIYAYSIFLLFVYLCIYFWIRIPNCIKKKIYKRLNIQLNSVRFLTDNFVVLSLYGIRTLSRLCSDRNIRSLVFICTSLNVQHSDELFVWFIFMSTPESGSIINNLMAATQR